MFLELIKFLIYSILIVLISKYILVRLLRSFALNLNLSSKAVGNIAGIATSIPELLTVSFSAFAGLISTSVFNIISSNTINLCQYILAVFLNKNQKQLKKRGLKIELLLVLFTILIPIFMLVLDIDFEIQVVPIFILLFIFFYYINSNLHKLYFKKEDEEISNEQNNSKKNSKKSKTFITIKYIIYLLITSVVLYWIGDQLSIVLEELAKIFNISEIVLGFALGFITSLPELITFFESQKHHKDEKTEGIVEATNNLLASNTLNLFIIQSIGIIITKLS